VLYLASHVVADQRVVAASAESANQLGGSQTQVQPAPHPQGGPVIVRRMRPSVSVAASAQHPLNPASPPLAVAPPSATTPVRPQLDPAARTKIIVRRSEQMKRQGLCRRLEQRRVALQQEHTASHAQN